MSHLSDKDFAITGGAVIHFEEEDNGDLQLITIPIFLFDENGDLMPSLDGTFDRHCEIDGDDNITPKE